MVCDRAGVEDRMTEREQLAVAKRLIRSLVADIQDGSRDDTFDLAELLYGLGIITEEQYNPAFHDDLLDPGVEINLGDPVYLIAPAWRVQP